MLKILYSIFIGVLTAAFIGFGMAAFYPAPEAPDIQVTPPADDNQEEASEQQQEAREEYRQEQEQYNDDRETHAKNTSIAVVALAIVVLVISMSVASGMGVIADGLLIGGILTLIYGVGRSFDAGDERLTFAVVAVGLVIAIVIGYKKFAAIDDNGSS